MVLTIAAVSFSGCIGFWTGESDVPAPALVILDIDGGTHDLQADGLVLVDMFGTWCGPCIRGIPFMQQMLDTYPGLSILSISGTDTEAQVAEFRQEFNITWNLAVDAEAVRQIVAVSSSRNAILWPSYALVHDGQIVFFNAGETLPATFAAAIEAELDAPVEQSGNGTLLGAVVAFILGAIAWFSPFQFRETALRTDDKRRQILPWLLIGIVLWTTVLAVFVAFANRPLTGRVYNVSTFVLIGTPLAIWWWQRHERSIANDTARERVRKEHPVWREGLQMPGGIIYHAFPAWAAIVFAGLWSVDPMRGLWLQVAFGTGLFIVAALSWTNRLNFNYLAVRVGWIGAAGWILGIAWIAGLRFL